MFFGIIFFLFSFYFFHHYLFINCYLFISSDLGEILSSFQLVKIFTDFDQDRNGKVEFNEFVCGVVRYINSHQDILEGNQHKGLETLRLGSSDLEADNEEEPNEEEDDMPEDLAHLSTFSKLKINKFKK